MKTVMKEVKRTDEVWLLWRDSARSPAMNMAIDELLLESLLPVGRPLLRLYSWDRPSASFGYSQAPSAVLRKGLSLVRRPTGGGVVYHDNDLTYTIAIPATHKLSSLDRMESYKVLHEAVLEALSQLGVHASLAPDSIKPHDRATLQCFVSPSPSDVVAEDGPKLAGAAQRRTRQGILHQGSIALLEGVQRAPASAALIESVARKFNACFELFIPSEKMLDSAAKLANLKYQSEAWNLRKECPALD